MRYLLPSKELYQKPSFYIEKQFLNVLVCAQTLNLTPGNGNVTLQLKGIHLLFLLDVLSLLSVTAVEPVIAWEAFIMSCKCIASLSLNSSPYRQVNLVTK